MYDTMIADDDKDRGSGRRAIAPLWSSARQSTVAAHSLELVLAGATVLASALVLLCLPVMSAVGRAVDLTRCDQRKAHH